MPRLPLAALTAASLAGCATTSPGGGGPAPAPAPERALGRLSLPEPSEWFHASLTPGVHRLASEAGTAWVYIPADLASPRPLLVFFHGADGSARQTIDLLRPHAEAHGLVLLAPQSAGRTWDLLGGAYGPDAASLQQLLVGLSAMVPLDPARAGLAGFSDGASYALSLGLDNGDVFRSVVAFSPGFARPRHRVGSPRVFIAHGTGDEVLDIDACSRALVPRLRAMGYGVTYQEFDGKHAVPPEIASAGARWFTSG